MGGILERLALAIDVVSETKRKRRIRRPEGPAANLYAHAPKGRREFVCKEIKPWGVLLIG